ncbi:MAG: 50S ribosomal protein L10 [Thermodesulfobacteriota bacterium]
MDRSTKEKSVADMKERLEKAYAVFVVDYKGLNVKEITRLRQELREAEIELQVVKNRLLAIACQDTDAAVLASYLKGPCALAITYGNVVAPAKILTKFAQDSEKLEVKVAHIQGDIVEAPAVKRLAQLPGRDVLLSQVVFALSGVPISLVRLLAEVPRRMVNVLEAVRRQREAG